MSSLHHALPDRLSAPVWAREKIIISLDHDKIIISLDHGIVCHGLHSGSLHLWRGCRWHTVDVLDKALQQMRRLGSQRVSATRRARDSRRQQKTAEDSTRGAGHDARHVRQAQGSHRAPQQEHHQSAVRDVQAHGALLLAAPVPRADAWSAGQAGSRRQSSQTRGIRSSLPAPPPVAAGALHVGGPRGVSRGGNKPRGGTGAVGTRRVCELTVAVLQDLKHRPDF